MLRFSCYLLVALTLSLSSCHKTDDPDPTPPVTTYAGPPAPADVVMYEVNLRAHQPTPTLAGVQAKLDSIKSLGVNVVWLMPIYPVGQERMLPPLGSPYAVRDYRAVNPEFGTLADLKTFVAAAHDRGLAVILDWVANHTAWDNPWLTQHPDWYTHDASGHIISPPGTGWNDVADLDYTNAAMRTEMIAAMKYWVTEANVDGFRCDAADFVPDDFWQQALTELKAIPDHKLLLLAEGNRPQQFTAGFQLNYGWDFYAQLKRVFREGAPASTLFTTHQNEVNSLPAGARKLRFTTNHDETCWDDTPINIFGGRDGATAASVAALAIGGSPLIYNGQEVGANVRIPLFDRSTIDWAGYPTMRQAYRKLLTAYRNNAQLRTGALTTYPDADVLVMTRGTGGHPVLAIINTRGRPVTLTVPAALQGSSWRYLTVTNQLLTLGGTLGLQPYEYLLLAQ